jgi:lipoyl(octanoyl) transferase
MATLIHRYFTHADYNEIWQAMRAFTDTRLPETLDELWIVEHPAVYTLGQNGDERNILNANNIPVIKSDRGGQVTYHGPGQLVIYVLLNLQRYNLGIRRLVTLLENSVIHLLHSFDIIATTRSDAPGVYIKDAKICSIGLRIRRGFSYHGLALNVDMDLNPFMGIHPCGYRGLPITQLSHFGVQTSVFELAPLLIYQIEKLLLNK